MSSPNDRPIRIEFTLRSSQPEVLEGLDAWLRLGLLSEDQVRQLCREKLVCSLPQPVTVTTVPTPQVTQDFAEDFVTESVKGKSSNPPNPPLVRGGNGELNNPALPRGGNREFQRRPPLSKGGLGGVQAGMLQSLMAELSVRWLLFLGVFMVVVSSGVLAASQWERFPAAAQYGVLLAYTLIFWAVSFWAGKQNNLRLTAQTLQIVTLLLVPVNFWAMDSFGLWQNVLDWIAVAIATFALTGVTLLLLKNHPSASPRQVGQLQWLPILNFLGLSYLHWGWRLAELALFSKFPLIAVYLGMVGTSLIVFYQTRYRQQQKVLSTQTRVLSKEEPNITPSSSTQHSRMAASVAIYALVLLLVRAIFVVRIDITQLGLALGICGWLVAWLAQQEPHHPTTPSPHHPTTPSPQFSLETIGGILLLLGWLVSVGTTFPWQATAVSGLGLWFLGSRLTKLWLKADLAALFGVGLQTIWLVWRLVPHSLQQQAIATCTQLVGSQGIPFVLLSLALFPYVILMVRVTQWLYLRAKPNLAYFEEWLALILGSVLTLMSLANPTVRSLNLLFSTLTLGFVTQRRSPTRVSLVYLTHIMGLLTLGSAIDRLFPNLSRGVWASIILALMVVELGLSILDPRSELRIQNSELLTPNSRRAGFEQTLCVGVKSYLLNPPLHTPNSSLPTPNSSLLWRRSAWHIGLGLAGLSYSLLWENAFLYQVSDAVSHQKWGILWLITPLALTGVASQTAAPRRKLAAWLSVVAIFMAQILTAGVPPASTALPETRLIGLGIGVGLMLVNTNYVRQQAAAAITVGFSLSFIGWLLWDGVPGVPRLSTPGWFLVGAIAIISLWLFRTWLSARHGTLAAMYQRANDGWAIALCSFELFVLTLHSYAVFQGFAASRLECLIAATLIFGAIAYRSWRQPSPWAFYGVGWCLELMTAEVLGFASVEAGVPSAVNLAIANIALGLMTQLLGEAWKRLHPPLPPLSKGGTIEGGTIGSPPLSKGATIIGSPPLNKGGTIGSPPLNKGGTIGSPPLNKGGTGGVGELPTSCHILPLVYGVLGGLLRWGTFTSWTGLCSLSIALIAIGVGRRREDFKPLVYLGLIGVSISAYELLFYQLLQVPGGAFGDGLIAMSALGTGIMYAYRLLSPWLVSYLRLRPEELKVVSHFHWAWSSCLLMAAIDNPIASSRLVGLGTGVFLIRYALFQGRHHPNLKAAEIWVYLALLEFVGIRIYWLHTAVGRFLTSDLLVPWTAPLACVFAYFLYIVPWETWGWPKRPWHLAAYIWPLVIVWETRDTIYPISLLITAGFYVLLSRLKQQIRLTYLSVALVDWALCRWFGDLHFTDALWYVTPVGLSLLYVAQVDPALQLPSQRETRHYLRLFGSGAICVVAFLFHQDTGLQPGIISLLAILAGLALRVRAFLYVGTAIFLLNAFYQLVVLIFRHPFFKWVIGLGVGVIFIWIAASFETRREQLTSLVRNWIAQLEEWD